MLVTVEELQRLENMDISEINPEELDEAGSVQYDKTKPADRRMMEFLEKTKNPYAERVGDYTLVMTYSKESTETLEDKMIQLAKLMTEIPM